MNDPFDSMVGFSAEKIYDECVDLALDQIDISLDANLRLIFKIIVKNRMVGKTFEFINTLNGLKKYVFNKALIAHEVSNYSQYVARNVENLYKKCPPEIKKQFDKQAFLVFAILLKDYKDVEIKESTLTDVLKMEDALIALEEKTIEVRDHTYLPFIKDFLAKLTVVCFSASGWDNQLMWAHYANSYSGICVEYDFEKMNEFIGFVYPVEYCKERPSLTLRDLGITKLETDNNGNYKHEEVNMSAIISYMLAKNKCWEYEDEWRIINIGEKPYCPIFIDTPFIKSITLGLNVDEMCKQLLWDVCQEKNIECYQLKTNPGDYVLSREKLTEESFILNEDNEIKYITLLSEHTTMLSQKVSENSHAVIEGIKKGSLDVGAMTNVLTSIIDFLSDAYFMKISFNRCYNNGIFDASTTSPDTTIGEAIVNINNFIFNSKECALSIGESIANFVLTDRMTSNDYHKAKNLISNILEMVEKHNDLMWFSDQIIETPNNDQHPLLFVQRFKIINTTKKQKSI